MKPAQKQALNSYFKAVLPFCNMSKVTDLLAGLGYNAGNVTPGLCVKAYEERGKDFAQPFGKIARKALESPMFEAYKKDLTDSKPALNKADGDAAEMGLKYLDVFTKWFEQGSKIYHDSQYSEADATKAQADLAAAQAALAAQNTNNNKSWIIPVCVGVGVLILAVILVVVFRK